MELSEGVTHGLGARSEDQQRPAGRSNEDVLALRVKACYSHVGSTTSSSQRRFERTHTTHHLLDEPESAPARSPSTTSCNCVRDLLPFRVSQRYASPVVRRARIILLRFEAFQPSQRHAD
jgi:hypothetical protein